MRLPRGDLTREQFTAYYEKQKGQSIVLPDGMLKYHEGVDCSLRVRDDRSM